MEERVRAIEQPENHRFEQLLKMTTVMFKMTGEVDDNGAEKMSSLSNELVVRSQEVYWLYDIV